MLVEQTSDVARHRWPAFGVGAKVLSRQNYRVRRVEAAVHLDDLKGVGSTRSGQIVIAYDLADIATRFLKRALEEVVVVGRQDGCPLEFTQRLMRGSWRKSLARNGALDVVYEPSPSAHVLVCLRDAWVINGRP